jgi:putative ABC transport system substrate-binding protein
MFTPADDLRQVAAIMRGHGRPAAMQRRGDRMRRRQILGLAGVILIVRPAASLAQSTGKTWRIGYLSEGLPGPLPPIIEALGELGYREGQNLWIERRAAEGRIERLPELAAELAGAGLDVIVALGTREAVALQKATSTVPIVMLFPGDPVGSGLVKSLAAPGGNLTGTSLMFPDVGGKRLELLRDVVPSLRRVTILGNPRNPATAADMRASETAARAIGLQVHSAALESLDRLAESLGEVSAASPDGLLVMQDSLAFQGRARIAEFAVQQRLAAVFPGRAYAQSGGLIGYGPNMSQIGKRAVAYVDKILKGARPADLPVEQPTEFELVVNLKTATTLGLTIPAAVLARADEVIE